MYSVRISNVFAFLAVFNYTNNAQETTTIQKLTVELRDYSKYDLSTYFQSECKCMRLEDCSSMMSILTQSRQPMPEWLVSRIRKTGCGLDRGNHLVCCPNESLRRDIPTTEKPWVWDVEETNKVPQDESGEDPKARFNNYYNDFDGSNNLIDFKDPRTFKNCPPSFHDEYNGYHRHHNRFHHRGWYPGWNDDGFNGPPRKPPARKGKPLAPGVNTKKLVNAAHCGVSLNNRIIGGEDSGPGQFPWVVRVAYVNITSQLISYRCVGSAINERYIVTAAHCVTNLVDELRVSHIRLGDRISTTDCQTDPALCVSQDYEIESITPHRDYDTPRYANDIALIRILRPMKDGKITPICLPIDKFVTPDVDLVGKFGIVAGWSTRFIGTAQQSPTLQFVRLPIVNQTICASTYAQFSANSDTSIVITPAQLCAQGRENMDACQGDSGGPLMNDGSESTNRFSILGLVSFGPRTCGLSDFPGVYTRVQSYTDWILSNIAP